MANNVEFTVVFHEHGFVPGMDISMNEIEELRQQFMMMYDLWAQGANAAIDKINNIWEQYEFIRNTADAETILAMELATGIRKGMDYNDWIEKWYVELANAVDISFQWSRLQSFIFRDGDIPVYGVKFKDRPEWTMDFSVMLPD